MQHAGFVRKKKQKKNYFTASSAKYFKVYVLLSDSNEHSPLKEK